MIDGIEGPSEPSGSSAVAELHKTSTNTSGSTSSPAIERPTGSAAVKNSKPKSTSNQTASMKVLQEQPKKKQKLDGGQWKERYFEAFESMEQARCKLDAKTSSLKQYNILLQNIKLEKSLGII